MNNQELNALDILAMISFSMQVQNYNELRKQATNNDVIDDIHADIVRLESKIDRILESLQA